MVLLVTKKQPTAMVRATGTLSSGSEVTPAVTRTLHCAVIALRSRAVSSGGAAPPDKSELLKMHPKKVILRTASFSKFVPEIQELYFFELSNV